MTDKRRGICGRLGRAAAGAAVVCGMFAGFVVSGGIGQAWAYYTDSDVSGGSVSVGFCDVEILEEGRSAGDIPAGRAFRIEDAVRVSNTGTLPCFVRAAVDFDCYLTEEASAITGMSDRWVYDPDTMFWYYTGRLMPGETSELLMDGIDVSPLPDRLAEGYKVGIYVEAVDVRGGGF